MAKPIPRAPPVIATTFPRRSNCAVRVLISRLLRACAGIQPRHPRQRPTTRPRRRCTKSEVATGSSTRSLYPPELVATSRSIPASTRRPALGTTAPLSDRRGLAESIQPLAQLHATTSRTTAFPCAASIVAVTACTQQCDHGLDGLCSDTGCNELRRKVWLRWVRCSGPVVLGLCCPVFGQEESTTT